METTCFAIVLAGNIPCVVWAVGRLLAGIMRGQCKKAVQVDVARGRGR